MNSVCDVCGKKFYIENIEERFETMEDGRYVQVLFFRCPECGADYVISVFDSESTKLRTEWLSAQEKYRHSMATKRYGKALDETARKWGHMKDYNDRLKNRYLKESKYGD